MKDFSYKKLLIVESHIEKLNILKESIRDDGYLFVYNKNNPSDVFNYIHNGLTHIAFIYHDSSRLHLPFLWKLEEGKAKTSYFPELFHMFVAKTLETIQPRQRFILDLIYKELNLQLF